MTDAVLLSQLECAEEATRGEAMESGGTATLSKTVRAWKPRYEGFSRREQTVTLCYQKVKYFENKGCFLNFGTSIDTGQMTQAGSVEKSDK